MNCDGVGITEEGQAESFLLYPNPATSEIIISVPDFSAVNSQIQVYDSQGKLIEQFVMQSSTETLGVSNYPEGIYFIKLTSDGEYLATEKLMIVR